MNQTPSDLRLKESLEELARFGSPVDLSVAVTAVENEKVEIEQVGGIYESQLFELADGRVACMAYIAVTNQRARTNDVIDAELRCTLGSQPFSLVTAGASQVAQPSESRAAATGLIGSQVAWTGVSAPQVLNHHLLERKKLPGQNRLEGWLLGIGGRMPAGLRHGQWRDMRLTIIGSDHAEYSTTLHLWTDRLYARRRSCGRGQASSQRWKRRSCSRESQT